MASAWLLPEHIADVLPSQARRIEELRRELLDMARSYGCELVMPPLLEHLDSLLSGTGHALDLQTFKLVDQLSGRSLGLRADTTPQVARIDAHLLNRAGVTRLCYCGPVLHTRPAGLHSTREPLQFGIEIYGHGGLEADLEVQELALDAVQRAGLKHTTLDLGDARLVRGVLGEVVLSAAAMDELVSALATKDSAALGALSQTLPLGVRQGLQQLLSLYGGIEVLSLARQQLPAHPLITAALDDLQWLSAHLLQTHPETRLGFDLADLTGYAYYSGVRFALYAEGSSDAVLRGGRYDEVGAVFGRRRPAVGFSLDLKALEALSPPTPLRAAVKAPWSEAAGLRAAVRALRAAGETVVCVLPGHEHEGDEFDCDRELAQIDTQWVLRAL
ncbi:ATP phosphoribosyltransferase regulatory subunit [Roseateles oligotrophus]|uniref:ATP phosphoribosyltransferase regulatory subunit n=1 Tax=Roseateles oligotrophus TaxID=1769250 RepID=A0ABT2Y909_9BURK|nr:ATP phosphoribosyltransferase regulatory subunit [Roseateles oligotrophus]MCV2366786.1 ATP phosphoribosyltransferase regulatory subunit [Roseateles oligotrophus]